ncbi:MAG TPA: DUF262 domain-containing protein, partial [Candidatus Paceibacterota bacterium]|nr:DUF262 domain-containing protein [Candidatus Paceibacterota bacterium]
MREVSVRDVAEGWVESDELGVRGLDGALNVRPAYQREFVYDDAKRDAVIRTVTAALPLNTMYWAVNHNDTYEVLDGQQRTISLCRYVTGKFSVDYQYFHNLTAEEQAAILDYTLNVYVCEGTEAEKLEWFKTINISPVALTNQELRNAVYTGPWLS